MGVADTVANRTAAGHEPHMGVNHYGTVLLTLLLLGRMRRTARQDERRSGSAVGGHPTRTGQTRSTDGKAVRIVNVTSLSHRWVGQRHLALVQANEDGRPQQQQQQLQRLDRLRSYAASKLAGMMATRALAGRLGRDGVTANAVHPGVVHTQIPRHLAGITWLMHRYACAAISWLVLRTPQSGAQSVLYAVMDSNLDYVTGQYIE